MMRATGVCSRTPSTKQRGLLETVRMVFDECGAICSTSAMDRAASSGHLDIVQWLHENRSVQAMNGAASSGHLQVVQ
jgi:hypothetical protein